MLCRWSLVRRIEMEGRTKRTSASDGGLRGFGRLADRGGGWLVGFVVGLRRCWEGRRAVWVSVAKSTAKSVTEKRRKRINLEKKFSRYQTRCSAMH